MTNGASSEYVYMVTIYTVSWASRLAPGARSTWPSTLGWAQSASHSCPVVAYLTWNIQVKGVINRAISVCSCQHGLKQIKLRFNSRAGCEASLRSDGRLCLQSYLIVLILANAILIPSRGRYL